MHAEIIAIGDEITSGQSLDTNTQWIAQRLEAMGIRVLYHSTVGDELEPGAQVFRQAIARADVVIATGGLGPTADDLTREALARATGRELVTDAQALEHIREMFARRWRAMPPQNERQAHVSHRREDGSQSQRDRAGHRSGGRPPGGRPVPGDRPAGRARGDEGDVVRLGCPDAAAARRRATDDPAPAGQVFRGRREPDRGHVARPDPPRPRAHGGHHRQRRHDHPANCRRGSDRAAVPRRHGADGGHDSPVSGHARVRRG